MTSSFGSDRIVVERQRQVEIEEYTAERDDMYTDGELVLAAGEYIRANEQLQIDIPNRMAAAKEVRRGLRPGTLDRELVGQLSKLIQDMTDAPQTYILPRSWPWPISTFKPSADPIRNLEKAGALLAAEIDRLQRAKEKNNDE